MVGNVATGLCAHDSRGGADSVINESLTLW